MSRPQSCPGGQHVIRWLTPTLGVCSGHQCVWRYHEGKEGWGNLKGDWGLVAVELASALQELMNGQPAKAVEKPPVPDGSILVQWRERMKVSQRQAALMLKMSRSFIADVECGRKKMSPRLWEKIRAAS